LTSRITTTAALIIASALFLSGCKIRMTVPEGASVASKSGLYQCDGPAICDIEVIDTSFEEVFVAAPPPGMRFSHWRKANRFFCGGSNKPCALSTRSFSGTPLVEVLETDQLFFLEPVFEASLANPSFWQRASNIYEDDKYRTGRPTYEDLYRIVPNIENCDPGELTQWAKQRAQNALNEIRTLHSLPSVDYAGQFDAEVQAASLVQAANDYFVGHFPATSDRCYSQLAYDGASSSNLYYGSVDQNRDPLLDLIGWADDAFNVADVMGVGHRRHILNPDLGYIAYGQALGFSAQKVFDFNLSPKDSGDGKEFVALPFGAYPYLLVPNEEEKPTPWSIHIVTTEASAAEYDYFRQATVTVTQTASGKSLPISNVYSDSKRWSGRLHGNLSWIVADFDYDTEYTVQVSNVLFPTGERKNFSYPVNIIRRAIIDITEPLEPSDRRLENGIAGVIAGRADRDSVDVEVSARRSYRLTGQSRYSNWAFYAELYDANKERLVSTDEDVDINLMPGVYTLVVGNCSRS
jgi:hypothetical protein